MFNANKLKDIILCIHIKHRQWIQGVKAVLEITVAIGHFLTNFDIWPTKIHFGWLNLLYIFNGMAIDNL